MFGSAGAAQWDLTQEVLSGVRIHRLRHVRDDHARGDGVYPDFKSGNFARQCPGESDDARLRGAVVVLSGEAGQSANTGHIEYRAPTPHHVLDRRPRVIECTVEVRVDHLEPHRRFHAEKSLVATDSRVIDQHVEGPERPLYLVDYVLRPLKIPHIGLKRERSVSTFAQTPRKR